MKQEDPAVRQASPTVSGKVNGDRVAEIAARLADTLDGPWFAVRYYVGSGEDRGDPDAEIATAGNNADAQFIAHARQDIPYLLTELESARAKLAAVEWLADEWDKVSDKEMSFRFAASFLRAALATGEGEEGHELR